MAHGSGVAWIPPWSQVAALASLISMAPAVAWSSDTDLVSRHRSSPLPLMVALVAMDINSRPGFCRAMDPYEALGSRPGPDGTLALGHLCSHRLQLSPQVSMWALVQNGLWTSAQTLAV